ncbi:MAG: hypothetical protein M0Q24_11550 [Sulfurimonas sp.]|uniref:prepilin peptidase n=1 Tax=Sulfurimonas sp. TaxID=2022749 RepID=UPI0025F287F4|nr:prepilin peptidase [Sulfurimonas sp.]MCK9492706.1 hypothetical protein [Sulfurimonas sp.]
MIQILPDLPGLLLCNFLLCCSLLLSLILTIAAIDDLKYRYIPPRYFYPFWIIVFIPYLYISNYMIAMGLWWLVVSNIILIIYAYYLGKKHIIGGSDARVLIAMFLLWPFVFPALLVVLIAIIYKKLFFKFDEEIREDSKKRGVPAVVFLALGFYPMVIIGGMIYYYLLI